MGQDIFDSSDSVRSGARLRCAESVVFDEPVELVRGGRLRRVRVVYETYGRLNEARDNAVLVCHALSGDSHVARHDAEDDPGWWDVAVGRGKAIDTEKYFVICPNVLGGCRGTTGPNTPDPATGRPYGPEFPEITIADIVEVQRRLLDHLGIGRLLAAVGGSMGGMQVLQWAMAYPDRVAGAIPIATAAALTSQSVAFDVIGRNAITHDPNFRRGHYYDVEAGCRDGAFAPAYPIGGLAIARMIGHITYLSRAAMRNKFAANHHDPREVDSRFERDTSVASYLAYQGDRFVERFDANSYILISRAMDAFGRGKDDNVLGGILRAGCRWLVISFTSDLLFPPDQSREIVDALAAAGAPVSYCNVASECGHDAFLLAEDVDMYGGLIAGFLARTHAGEGAHVGPEEGAGGVGHSDTSIFRGRRLDYDLLERVIAAGYEGGDASVLDLGCGGGQMLLRLKRRGWRRLQGVEIDQRAVLTCVRRGIDCIHADLAAGLAQFADKEFDFVLLSRTIQAVYDVESLMDDILRVGRRCVVSIPNFGYEPLRRMLHEQGRAPEAGVLHYKWYNTPNIRCVSIADFEDFCREKGATIHSMVALNTEQRREITDDPNLNADLAVFVISRP